MLLRDLNKQAQAEGGAVYMVNGNHESLNVCGNFRYETIIRTYVWNAIMWSVFC